MDELVTKLFDHLQSILISELRYLKQWEKEYVVNNIITRLQEFSITNCSQESKEDGISQEEDKNTANLEVFKISQLSTVDTESSGQPELTGESSVLNLEIQKELEKTECQENLIATDFGQSINYCLEDGSSSDTKHVEVKQPDHLPRDCSTLLNVEDENIVVYMDDQNHHEALQFEGDSSAGDTASLESAEFPNQDSLDTLPLHNETQHIDWCLYYSKNNRQYSCKLCHKVYRSLSQVKLHLRGCHELGEKTLSCTHLGCTYSTRSASKFRAHKSWHSNNAALKCPLCEKEYLGGTKGLRNHMKIHSQQREFKCNLCEKLFINLSRLNYHIQNVHGEANYLCESCDRSFRSKANFIRHQRTHTSDKPFLCPYCSFNTGSSTSLTCHVRSVHKDHDFTTGKSDKLRKKVERSGAVSQQRNLHLQSVIDQECGVANTYDDGNSADYHPMLVCTESTEEQNEPAVNIFSENDLESGESEQSPVITVRNQDGRYVKAVVKVKRNKEDAVLHVVMES